MSFARACTATLCVALVVTSGCRSAGETATGETVAGDKQDSLVHGSLDSRYRARSGGGDHDQDVYSVLALDLGQSRIGVAVSDDLRRVAVPVGTVRTGAPGDVRAIAALVREHGVAEVVVGHPLRRSPAGDAADV